ncbi:hypothetical protein [Ancylobacter sp. TS-1]|uniref:hypothetical protein n=1 Tax=Ancylobacter sp. TS-1 TaxID=1850374 RepID=UPI001265B4EC|nr:hypothetical protein [Ancylobacter sp. TS-1]QFR33187.1 hypothetical protein GBB76_08590 [Ancylobacter sp. TS-1]
MSRYESIKIDLAVYKAIIAEKQSFSETPNSILRRLLNIDINKFNVEKRINDEKSWVSKEITLPHGTRFKTIYNKKEYEGSIVNGEWNLNGSNFSSPSAAISSVAKTKSGKRTNLNGWNYWMIMIPGTDKWRGLDEMRKRTVTLEDLD